MKSEKLFSDNIQPEEVDIKEVYSYSIDKKNSVITVTNKLNQSAYVVVNKKNRVLANKLIYKLIKANKILLNEEEVFFSKVVEVPEIELDKYLEIVKDNEGKVIKYGEVVSKLRKGNKLFYKVRIYGS